MRRLLKILPVVALMLGACAPVPPDYTANAAHALAPGGVLRVAINFGNPILATKDPVNGAPEGISVDLANELGRRLGRPVKFVTYEAAGRVVEGIKSAQWDVAFVAIDPVRGADMLQSTPYVLIEGAYLVREDSALHANSEVDRTGVRVVVGKGSAYDLFLTRELKMATLVRAPTSPEVTDMFLAEHDDVAAGVRQQLEADARRVGGVRLLPGRFMQIDQAIAIPKEHGAGRYYLIDFVEEMKSSGFVAEAIARHHIDGCKVAPPAPTR